MGQQHSQQSNEADGGWGSCALSPEPHYRYSYCCLKVQPHWNYEQRQKELSRVVNNVQAHGRRHVPPRTLEAHKAARRRRQTHVLTQQYGPGHWVAFFRDDPRTPVVISGRGTLGFCSNMKSDGMEGLREAPCTVQPIKLAM
ncbi:hypothetical protein M406DRAFT_357724 [Cryphonectria parasitica EP155]|uniref:Uncharacterized protein n=1 Tax=Cryphonectria parasitica (strain ATCC 38755 / EP155) TaxID=660469 RepID=A0A9P4XV59_CRYP1|nr:uncharacterized protein M406DRAFT_357724 [Cryphonectria parasitica EP155]KAF3761412.1 hypothetical protein M406DRAFT_357724 [Cryphonectria parasitica EP155]